MTKARYIAKELWEAGQRLAPEHNLTPLDLAWEDLGVDTRRWSESMVKDLIERGIIR